MLVCPLACLCVSGDPRGRSRRLRRPGRTGPVRFRLHRPAQAGRVSSAPVVNSTSGSRFEQQRSLASGPPPPSGLDDSCPVTANGPGPAIVSHRYSLNTGTGYSSILCAGPPPYREPTWALAVTPRPGLGRRDGARHPRQEVDSTPVYAHDPGHVVAAVLGSRRRSGGG